MAREEPDSYSPANKRLRDEGLEVVAHGVSEVEFEAVAVGAASMAAWTMSCAAASQGLTGTTREFRGFAGADLLARTQAFETWRAPRAENCCWPYSRALQAATRTETTITDATGQPAHRELRTQRQSESLRVIARIPT